MANPITLEEASKKAIEYMEKREKERYKNPVSLPDLEAALDELILQEDSINLEPYDVTVSRLARKTQWNTYRCKTLIAEWLQAGKLEYIGKRREPERGQKVDAWRLKGKE